MLIKRINWYNMNITFVEVGQTARVSNIVQNRHRETIYSDVWDEYESEPLKCVLCVM